MKLIKTEPAKFDSKKFILDLEKSFKDYRENPVRAYGDYLFDQYVENHRPDIQFWLSSDGSNCLSCKLERVKQGKDFLGCDSCWACECDSMKLSEQFSEQAKKDFHKLSPEEIANIMRLDKERHPEIHEEEEDYE